MTIHMEKCSDWFRALAILAAFGILANGCRRATKPASKPASVPTKGVTVTIRQSDEDAIRGLLAQLLEYLNTEWALSSAPPDYADCKPHEDLMTYGWKAVPYLIEQVALREDVDAYIGSALIDDAEVDTPKEVYDYNLARQRAVDTKTMGPHILAQLLRELPSGNEVPSLDTSNKTISAGVYTSVYAWLNWWQESKHRFTFRTKRPPVIAPPKDRHTLVPQITASYKNKLLTLYSVRSSIKEIIERGAAEMEVNIVVPEPPGRQPERSMSSRTIIRMKSVTTGEFLYRVGSMIWGVAYDKMDEKLELRPAI